VFALLLVLMETRCYMIQLLGLEWTAFEQMIGRVLAEHYHHHHISFMELNHLLTRSSLTYPEVSSKVYLDSFCQMGGSISLNWVINFESFCLRVVGTLP
jgi:hypothetical protein